MSVFHSEIHHNGAQDPGPWKYLERVGLKGSERVLENISRSKITVTERSFDCRHFYGVVS